MSQAKIGRTIGLSSKPVRIALFAAAMTLLVLVVGDSSPRAAGTFTPTITMETSTSRATAHPDARITIDNSSSDENIKDLTMSLPDGFWGSLGAIPKANRCVDPWSGCDPEAKIGTVTATALIEDVDTGTEADGVLKGDVFLTEDVLGNGDPAGVAIIVQAKVGGIDLGTIVVPARAKIRTALLTGWSGSAAPTVVGLDTIATDIPQDIYDFANDRFVSYKVEKMQIDLISQLRASEDVDYLPPLLTNPSRCGTYEISADFVSYDSSNATDSENYVVDDCDSVRLDPTATTEFSDATIAADSSQGLVTNISLPSVNGQPETNGSMQRIRLRLPRGMGANLPAFGETADMCTGGSLTQVGSLGDPNTTFYFEPSSCDNDGPIDDRPQAKVGTATIKTPLLPPDEELIGEVYAVNKNPIPGLAIYIREPAQGGPSTNPAGINTAMATIPSIVAFDPTCGTPCGSGILADFTALPDVPISEITVDLDGPSRAGVNGSLSGRILKQASADETCQATNDVAMDFWGTIGGESKAVVTTTPTSGCPAPRITPTTGPWGAVTTDDSPTFDFTYSGLASTRLCGIDQFTGQSSDCTATSSFSGSSLTQGSHTAFVGDGATDAGIGSGGIVRYFGVRETVTYDNTVPTTTISAGPGVGGPGTTADSTPSFTFNADETSEFQCSLDDGAFLPCGSATGTASDTYEIPVDEALDASDVVHSFRVRAQDDAGNVDLTPAEVTFTVEKPFSPTADVALTTNAARGNPEMTVTFANQSHEDLKDLEFSMPDGFFGGLTGVAALCSIADADAGNCAAGSQVGTVDATAVVDLSTARVKGAVYLTDPRTAGDPAGLTIEIRPQLQAITFDPIRVHARLAVRGEAEGIDTFTLDIPNETVTTIGEVSDFDMRSLVLKLNNNNAAPRPLLTNPSSCTPTAFESDFTGYGASTATDSSPVTFTGCSALGFGPSLSMSITDSTTGGPPGPNSASNPVSANLSATVTADPGSAGIRDVDVLMPKPVSINVLKVPLACTQEQQQIDACPASAKVGSVSAISPLLPEPLNGDIYLLRGPTAGVPYLFLRLRGRLSVDIIARNKFVNDTQLQSNFVNLPDVPLSSFTMNVNEFLSTRNEACDYAKTGWNATGSMRAWNDKTAPINNALSFNCPNADGPVFRYIFKPRKNKTTLAVTVDAMSGTDLRKATIKLPRGYKFNKKSFTKKLIKKRVTVTGDGGRLNVKCFKLRSATTFEVNNCKKQYGRIVVSFKAGSINTKSRAKKIKLRVNTVDSNGKSSAAKQL